jgi:hypothetical protein
MLDWIVDNILRILLVILYVVLQMCDDEVAAWRLTTALGCARQDSPVTTVGRPRHQVLMNEICSKGLFHLV